MEDNYFGNVCLYRPISVLVSFSSDKFLSSGWYDRRAGDLCCLLADWGEQRVLFMFVSSQWTLAQNNQYAEVT